MDYYTDYKFKVGDEVKMIVDDGILSYQVNGKDLGIAYDDWWMDWPNVKPFLCLSNGDQVEILKGLG